MTRCWVAQLCWVVFLAGVTAPFKPRKDMVMEAVERYHRILLECYEAQLAWRTGS